MNGLEGRGQCEGPQECPDSELYRVIQGKRDEVRYIRYNNVNAYLSIYI